MLSSESTNIGSSLLPSTSTHGNETDQVLKSNSSGPSQIVIAENHSVVLEKVTYKRVVFNNSDLSPDSSTQPKSPENNFSFVDSEQSESDCSGEFVKYSREYTTIYKLQS